MKDQEVCCLDPNEDRISVGAGDSCCGGIPYFNNGFQICCDEQLHDGYDQMCCGNEVLGLYKIDRYHEMKFKDAGFLRLIFLN